MLPSLPRAAEYAGFVTRIEEEIVLGSKTEQPVIKKSTDKITAEKDLL